MIFRARIEGDPTPDVVWQKGKFKKMQNNTKTRVFFDESSGMGIQKYFC